MNLYNYKLKAVVIDQRTSEAGTIFTLVLVDTHCMVQKPIVNSTGV